MNNRIKGKIYEKKAEDYLISRGVKILERNYCGKHGEVDLIGLEGDYYIFIEVKYRKNSCFGEPIEAIDMRKMKKIYLTAIEYIEKNDIFNEKIRFDAITILGRKVEWIKNLILGDEIC